MTVCSRPEYGLRCLQGVNLPLKLSYYLHAALLAGVLIVPLKCLQLVAVHGGKGVDDVGAEV